MSKKSLFGFGVIVGGAAAAAYVAFSRLNKEDKKRVVSKVNHGVNNLKDRAVDYAFYASDAIDDIKQVLSEKADNVKDSLDDTKNKIDGGIKNATDDNGEDKNSQFKTAADRLKDELHDSSEDAEDDIVVNADDVLNHNNNKRVETFYPQNK